MAIKKTDLIPGRAAHRRTQTDYMSILLDTVTVDDWREVVIAALTAAKSGDAPARAWLAQYLVGKAETKAPAPLTVILQQLNGHDPLVTALAAPIISEQEFPGLSFGDPAYAETVMEQVKEELKSKWGIQLITVNLKHNN